MSRRQVVTHEAPKEEVMSLAEIEDAKKKLEAQMAELESKKRDLEAQRAAIKAQENIHAARLREAQVHAIAASVDTLLLLTPGHSYSNCSDSNLSHANDSRKPCARCALLAVKKGETWHLIDYDFRVVIEYEPIGG